MRLITLDEVSTRAYLPTAKNGFRWGQIVCDEWLLSLAFRPPSMHALPGGVPASHYALESSSRTFRAEPAIYKKLGCEQKVPRGGVSTLYPAVDSSSLFVYQ